MIEQKNHEFAFFIDESGSPKPNPKDTTPYFALGGVLVKRIDEVVIEKAVAEFKQRWNIILDTPLHGNEIRSKKKKFAWLGKLSEQEKNKFMEDLKSLSRKIWRQHLRNDEKCIFYFSRAFCQICWRQR